MASAKFIQGLSRSAALARVWVRQNKGTKSTIAFQAYLCFAAKFARSRPPVLNPVLSGRFLGGRIPKAFLSFSSAKSYSPGMLIGPHASSA